MSAPTLYAVRTILPPPEPTAGTGVRRAVSLQPVTARVLVVAALAAVAFHYSLASLGAGWRFANPLADLALVPLLAVAIAVVAARRHTFVETVALGRLDVLVAGVSLVAVAAALLVAPLTMGNYYWALRPDLLVMPLLAVAGIALLLGTRSVLALLFPLALLLLAWPLPFTVALDAASGALTSATSAAVRALLPLLPAAHAVAGGSDLLVHVDSARGGFDVSVVSACSGIEGLTGLLVVATAAMYVVRGPLLARAAWLAAGLVVAWIANVARIVALLAAGAWVGRSVAMEVLHPVAGLVLLNAVFAVMLLSLRRFGLSLRALRAPIVSDVPLTRAVEGTTPPSTPRLWRRALVFGACAGLLAVADSSLASAAGAFDNVGRPAAVPFSARADAGAAVVVERVARNDWARPYFGEQSVWQRYRLKLPQSAGGYTVWLDSITTPDLAALRAHPVVSCYRFHRFTLQMRQRLALADGVVAERFVYTRPDGAQWHTIAWQWPVVGASGRVRHERVVLFASSIRSGPVAAAAVTRPGGPHIRDALLALLDRAGPNRDPNPAVTSALVAEANTVVKAHVTTRLAAEGQR